mmetsp:Transcript_17228/g.53373  ORF Transcript_17228/g.53373 Transcript_17228/m.53373 type:complete len:256 (+) Transcript_17228:784-1551(+)
MCLSRRRGSHHWGATLCGPSSCSATALSCPWRRTASTRASSPLTSPRGARWTSRARWSGGSARTPPPPSTSWALSLPSPSRSWARGALRSCAGPCRGSGTSRASAAPRPRGSRRRSRLPRRSSFTGTAPTSPSARRGPLRRRVGRRWDQGTRRRAPCPTSSSSRPTRGPGGRPATRSCRRQGPTCAGQARPPRLSRRRVPGLQLTVPSCEPRGAYVHRASTPLRDVRTSMSYVRTYCSYWSTPQDAVMSDCSDRA